MYNSDNYLALSDGDTLTICLPANCFCKKNSAVLVFPTLLADFKNPIQNRDRVPALCDKLQKAHVPSILLL